MGIQINPPIIIAVVNARNEDSEPKYLRPAQKTIPKLRNLCKLPEIPSYRPSPFEREDAMGDKKQKIIIGTSYAPENSSPNNMP
jgi:hypothetical protein